MKFLKVTKIMSSKLSSLMLDRSKIRFLDENFHFHFFDKSDENDCW